ncbi:MAG: hypothetical protein HQL64_12660 [Magnetococcales bacterium]|nr:hypothetical protein [Magnetococcales bacterium]
MGGITADLQVNFASLVADTPFELVVDDSDQVGSTPVQVNHSQAMRVFITRWGMASWHGSTAGSAPLQMLAPGKKRVKVYCALADVPFVRIHVDNGETTFRYTRITQNIIQWSDSAAHYSSSN